MSRWMGRNLSLLLLSLMLAFFFWAVATEAENPTIENLFGTPIPIEIAGVPEGMKAYGLSDSRVRVELRTPRSVWESLSADDIRAYIDLSEATTGTLTVPLHVEVRIKPVQVVKVTPQEVKVNVEPIADKEVVVVVKLQGTPLFGYKADEPVVAPRTVRVQGPTSWVDKVASAQVQAPVQDQQSDVRNDYVPVALDHDGDPVPNVEIMPKTVTVDVPIWQLGYIRDLAVTVALEGQPAPGYRVANLEVVPPVVKVFGRTDVVRAAPGFLQTQPINLEGITRSLTTTVALQMSEGLSVLLPSQPQVTVTLSIEAIRSGVTLNVRPMIRGLAKDLTATIGVDSVVVILSGPLPIMDTLDAAEVELILDLTNFAPGDYTLIPIVTVPGSVTIENVIPEVVPVKIESLSLPPGTARQ